MGVAMGPRKAGSLLTGVVGVLRSRKDAAAMEVETNAMPTAVSTDWGTAATDMSARPVVTAWCNGELGQG